MSRTRRSVVLAVAAGVAAAVCCASPASADTIRADSWHLAALGLPELHSVSQGEGVTVAVVDTGVDATHPDLAGNVLPGWSPYEPAAKGQVDPDPGGHGTGMASLIAGHGHGAGNRDGVLGIAPKAKILPIGLKVDGRLSLGSPETLGQAIKYGVEHGAQVINVSLSSSNHPSITSAVNEARSRGVIVVAAVGNKFDGMIGAPAGLDGVIAVAGSGKDGNIGPETVKDLKVAIAAPSVDMVSAVPGGKYRTGTGTSAASAVVSGAVALLRAKYPNEHPGKIVDRLLGTTTDKGSPGRDMDYGWGVLNLRDALTKEPRPAPGATSDSQAAAEPTSTASSYAADAGETGPVASRVAILVGGVLVVVVLVVLGVILVVRSLRRRPVPATTAPPGVGVLPGGYDPSGVGVPPGGYAPPPPAQQGQHQGPPPHAGGASAGDPVWMRPPDAGPPPQG